MKWTRVCLVSAGVFAVLAPGCSGSVKGSDANTAGDTGNAGLGGDGHGGSASGAAGSGGASGSHTGPIIGGGGNGPRPGMGGDAGSAGDAGYGGWVEVPPSDAGAGGVANDACAAETGNGCIIEYGDDISALATDGTSIYWVTHGTFDALGNYKNDGRLFKRDFGAATATQLATGLAGPVGIGLTTTHFYVYLDQAWDADGQYALARIPVAGGSAAIVQRGARLVNARGDACPNCFAHSGSIAVFPFLDGVYEMDSADTAPTELATIYAYSLTTAGQFVYVEGGAGNTDQIWRTPLSAAGSQPERVAATPSSVIQAVADHLYGVQSGEATYLAGMPVTGSMWTHLSKIQPGAVYQLDVADTHYFYDLEAYDQPYRIYEGRIETPSGGNLALSVPRKANVKAWVGSSAGLYWTDGHSLRLRSGLPE